MSRLWLLDISIGPVSRFIAAGRRSRDLWWGSTWLSECARRTAEKLADFSAPGLGVELLVPSQEKVTTVAERSLGEPLSYAGRVSNRLRLVITAESSAEVADLAARADEIARATLVELIRESVRLENPRRRLDIDPEKLERQRRQVRGWLSSTLDEKAFDAQLQAIPNGDFLELYASWTPLDVGFAAAFRRADRLLSARKSVRPFGAPVWTRPGLRKSDLDAGRDTVLFTASTWPAPQTGERSKARRRLGIGPDEGLDALGLARRISAFTCGPMLEALPFPPLSRVAADAWIEGVKADPGSAETFDAMKNALESARRNDLFFTWCSLATDPGSAPGRHQPSGLFPYDASILFEGGLDAQWAAIQRLAPNRQDDEVQEAFRKLAALRPPIERLHRRHAPPVPYYALLEMDGDGIGAALGSASSQKEVEVCVAALDSFADRAEELVRHRHGCAFYVGGDELVAYLPADTALPLARDLAESFQQHVTPTFRRLDLGAPTLSGGIALAHVRADLRSVRRQASNALRNAKTLRRQAGDTVAWLEMRDLPRSGAARACAGRLDDLATGIETWRRLLAQDLISLRSAHELDRLTRRLRDNEEDDGGSLGIELASFRVVAQQERSDLGGSEDLPERLREVATWDDVRRIVVELLVASRVRQTGEPRPADSPALVPVGAAP